jgi:glutathione-regulated potassium-efflux system protein KefB
LFFMAVGMSIDLHRIASEPGLILAGMLVLLLVKFTLLALLGLRPGRLDLRGTLLLGGTLALGGEFAFVVFGEAAKVGLLDAPQRDRLVAIVGLSMAVTPLLLLLISKFAPASTEKKTRDFDEMHDEHPHVLIAGFGRFGQIVARLLSAHKIPFIAIDPDVEQVDFVRRFGNQIYYGDPTRPDLLRAAGAAHVQVFVVAIDGVEASLDMTRLLRQHYPDAQVFARARDRRHAWQLMDMGAKVFRELFGSSVEMGREVLVALGVAREQADARVRHFRVHDAKLLEAQRHMQEDEVALLQSAKDARRELAELFEADVGEGQLGRIVDNPLE